MSNSLCCRSFPNSAAQLFDIGPNGTTESSWVLEVVHHLDKTFITKWDYGIGDTSLPNGHNLCLFVAHLETKFPCNFMNGFYIVVFAVSTSVSSKRAMSSA